MSPLFLALVYALFDLAHMFAPVRHLRGEKIFLSLWQRARHHPT